MPSIADHRRGENCPHCQQILHVLQYRASSVHEEHEGLQEEYSRIGMTKQKELWDDVSSRIIAQGEF